MMYLLLICQLALAVILLLAATGKFLNAEQFLAALRLSHFPGILVTPIAILTPLIEVCLALGLVFSTPQSLPPVLIATVALLSIFTVWMLTVSMRGLRVQCGCFGAGAATIGSGTILRNVLLIAVSLLGLVLSLHLQSPLPAPSFWMVMIVLSLGMTLILLRAFQQGKKGLILSTAQLERVQATTQASAEL